MLIITKSNSKREHPDDPTKHFLTQISAFFYIFSPKQSLKLVKLMFDMSSRRGLELGKSVKTDDF